ncbi:MAG: lamin tail domain-containing protein [Candidatus Omnitrophica bacterium]|nr:lamin tail domain-containing protein [Candidatus Omnitrophota bacterium]
MISISRILVKFAFFILVCSFAFSSYAQIVINEIHYDPDDKTEWVEFIELYNAGVDLVDLSGWHFRNAVEFQFPEASSIPAGGYVIVGQDPAAIASKYNVSQSLIYGPFEGRLDNNREEIELSRPDGRTADRVTYTLGFPWPTVGDPIPEYRSGSSHSIQLVHPLLDNDLGGSWRSGSPTPGKQNSDYAENIPPQIRQVKQSPQQPKANESVLISVKVSDPDGVASVKLLYQIVDPGDYIALDEARYESDWTEIDMHDDGIEGDEIAGDFTYSVEMPPSLQKHRRFIRYRISVSDLLGNSLTVPYSDDPQPNFAYFCYDGAPPWTGAVQPGVTAEVTYSSEMLESIPVYHLICSKEEVENCTWLDQNRSNEYPYTGTLVYDGVVYDHIQFRARGGTWRFAMAKNMWKFNMNRGHAFQGRDNYGRKYNETWDKVNLGANIQQADYRHRGEQGMFESVGFKLFNMAGIESSNTNFVHFRIIDEEHEDGNLNEAHASLTSGGTQYDGDFWGLYLATEQVDGRFLDEHDLPDGNLYKMESGTGEIRNQSPYGVSDASDMRSFMSDYQRRPRVEWWRENTDIERYANYRCIVEAIHQYDIAYGKNYYYYLNPETGKWFQIAWDLDLTWADNMYGNGEDPFKQAGILNHEEINIEYQNRMREIRDLLYNPDQTGQLIDEYASFIYNPGGQSFVDADRSMWDYHWVMSDKALQMGYRNSGSKSGQGLFYRISPTRDFAGMLTIMKNYVVSRGSWIDRTVLNNDAGVPDTPVIQSIANGFRVDSLKFEINDFSDPNNDAFSAMQWRIAEVEPFSTPWNPSDASGEDGATVLIDSHSLWRYFKGTQEPSPIQGAWRQYDFDDTSWRRGQCPIGYGENFISTLLSDMQGNYTTIYLRKPFKVEDVEAIDSLTAQVLFDDGFNMWINGVHVAQAHVDSEELPYDALAEHRENLEYIEYELPDPRRYLVEGNNMIAIQVINQYLDRSSDCFMDVSLVYGKKQQSEPEQEEPASDRDGPLKYEIDAIWQSEEMTAFQNQMTIPGDNLTPGKTYRVRARVKDNSGMWSHWSMPVQFAAQESDASLTARENLRITEIMFNPPEGSPFEYIELHNLHSSSAVSLEGFAFTEGVSYTFPAGTTLEPNGYLLLTPSANNEEKIAFQQHYDLDESNPGLDDSIPIAGPYEGKLANGGERITLKPSLDGDDFITFEYSDGRGWPLAADGAGHSLVPLDEAIELEQEGSLEYGGNWRASAYIGGSPGLPDPQPIRSIVINEFMANPDDGNDWIEIYNASSNTIHLGDWFLSDDKNEIKKWALPPYEISPGGFLYFDAENDFNASGNGFGLSKNGEQILLSYLPGAANADRVVDGVQFKAQENEYSWGRVGDGGEYWRSMPPTIERSNQSGRFTVVIDELMYHPADDALEPDFDAIGEYIELYNPSTEAVPLWNQNASWRLNGGVEFIFPANCSLPAGGRILVVAFNPIHSNDLDTFIRIYNINTENTQILGPYSDRLSNHGERIALEKLMDVDPVDGSLAWAIIDEVIYFDQSPWTPDADGTGLSLQRVSTTGSGNDPQNWQADSASPGEEGSPTTPVSDWMIYSQ